MWYQKFDSYTRSLATTGLALIIVWGDEAKNGSIPPTRGLRVWGRERDRDRETERARQK